LRLSLRMRGILEGFYSSIEIVESLR